MQPPLRMRLSHPCDDAAVTPSPGWQTNCAGAFSYHVAVTPELYPPAIATIVRVNLATVRQTVHRFMRRRPARRSLALHDPTSRARPPSHQSLLVRTMDQNPRRLGIWRAACTASALADYPANGPAFGSAPSAFATICIRTATHPAADVEGGASSPPRSSAHSKEAPR